MTKLIHRLRRRVNHGADVAGSTQGINHGSQRARRRRLPRGLGLVPCPDSTILTPCTPDSLRICFFRRSGVFEGQSCLGRQVGPN